MKNKKIINIWFAAIIMMGLTTVSAAQTPYYEGKSLTVIVGFSPGGGTDFFGRLVAENIGQHIDGNPNIIVENMPGAGSVLASNYFVDRAKRDGSQLLVGTGQLLMRIVLGLEGSTASLSDLEPIVALPMGRITFGSTKAGLNSPSDMLNPRESLALGVPGIISTIDAVLGLELLGIEYQAIVGYAGKSDAYLGFERGELNIDSQTTPVYLRQPVLAVEEGRAVPLFSQGLLNAKNELIRDPAAPDIPTVAEVYRDFYAKDPSGPIWESYKAAVTAIGNGGKILMIHSSAPQEAKQALSNAVIKLLADEEFLAKATKASEGYNFTSGAELAAVVQSVAEMSEDDTNWLRNYLSVNFELKFN